MLRCRMLENIKIIAIKIGLLPAPNPIPVKVKVRRNDPR